MMTLYAAPDLRSRIACYLHGRVIDDQGRSLLDEAADTLCRAEQLLNYWQRRTETAESADTLRDAENAAGK